MKLGTLLVTAAVAAVLATPAFAWSNSNTGNGPTIQSASDSGPAQSQLSQSRARARATGGSATGGSATGGNATGGAGGSARLRSSVTVNNTYAGGGGSGDPSGAGVGGAAGGYASPSDYASGVNVDARQAPDVLVPSVGGGGGDCPVVGFGVGGSGLGGGGGFGPSWISPDCNARKLAGDLDRMGQHRAAIALLADHFPEVKRALDEQQLQAAREAPPVVAQYASSSERAVSTVPDYCLGHSWTQAERRRHPECNH